MTIQEIEKRILEEARTEAAKIMKEAGADLQQLEKAHASKKEEIKQQNLGQAERQAQAAKRSLLVPARLSARKALLAEKQKILGKLYQEIQKAKKLSAAELTRLREESEIAAAKALFG